MKYQCIIHRIVDNMPVTWCYDVEDGQRFCNPGFPIGCYITEDGRPKDACVINVRLSLTFFFNIPFFTVLKTYISSVSCFYGESSLS